MNRSELHNSKEILSVYDKDKVENLWLPWIDHCIGTFRLLWEKFCHSFVMLRFHFGNDIFKGKFIILETEKFLH